MRIQLSKPVAVVFTTMSLIVMAITPALAQFEDEYDPGLPIFERTWNRTDLPVAEGEAQRTWIWGPGRTQVMTEPYTDAPGGERTVQYFDKSRMEDNSWRTTTPPWDVTNGLLVVEMVEGWYQIGDEEFDHSPAPADIQIAGDPGQTNAPTYRDINEFELRDMVADEVGQVITRTWTAANQIGNDESLAQYNVTAEERLTVPGIDHTVASPFWEFMNSEGIVYIDGEYVNDELFLNPYYATGYPITEAFWSQVPLLGEEQWVLWQCFERRCLTYAPTNPEGFQVEAGNVGQHYWLYRYGEPEPPPPGETEFHAILSGDAEVPPVETDASGTASFIVVEEDQSALAQAGLSIAYELRVSNIENVAAAHIHLAPPGENGGVVVPLFGLDEGEEPVDFGPEGGVLASGTITDEDLTGDLEGMTITDLINEMVAGNTYVNVHTEANPGGEIRGQIQVGPLPAPPDNFDGEYYVELNALNESGVYGAATLELDGNQLTVMLHATGLTANEMHMQHIHGPEGEEAICPDATYDENEDGLVDIGEGAPAYGPVVIPLFEDAAAETYPTADGSGEVRYTNTFTLSDAQLASLGNPIDRVIALHGMEADEEYVASLPVACGEIVEMPEDQDLQYYVNLDSLNESGVTGTVELTLNGPWLTVELHTDGNEPGQVHPQHIHGLADANATCPDETFDDDENGIVSVGEGAPAYGPVLLPLTPFQTASEEGEINYAQQLLVNLSRLGDLTERAIVTHGMVDPNTSEYDPSIPVSCGEIMEGELPPPPEEQEYGVLFGELNNSGVSGFGSLTLVNGELTVDLDVSGYVPDMVHMQHIHGLEEDASVCPGPDADTDDDDSLVSLAEGAPYYGGVVLPLFADVEGEEYPTADEAGNLDFSMTYSVDAEALGDLTSRVIVLHGLNVDEEYDGTVPVACGLIVPTDVETYIADDLSSDNVPSEEPIESDGEGEAWFWYDAEGDMIYYMLSVRNLSAVTAAHIHIGEVGESAGVIVPLFTPDIPEGVTYDAFGILATGRITAEDLSGDLAGDTLADLVALFGETDETSDAYVNVHTEANPGGEIRDQVTTVVNAM